jgi:hypothetical protein
LAPTRDTSLNRELAEGATLTELASPLTSINRGLGLLQSWQGWNGSTMS